MGKSFKSRKKARTEKRRSLRPDRIDSTAGVVLPADSQPPASLEASESIPPSSGVESEPPRSSSEAAEAAEAAAESAEEKKPSASKIEKASSSKIEAKKADDSGDFRARKGDDSGQFSTFFAKTEEDIHHEEARREAPDLHDPEVAPAVIPRRPVDKRARNFVAAVVGFAALLGLAGFVMRKTPKPMNGAATATQVVAPPETPAAVVPAPTPAPVPAPVPEPVATTAPAATEAATAPPAATVAAAPSTTTTAAPAATTAEAAAPAPSAAPADPDEALSGRQLLAQAKSAINANNSSRAAALAKKAIAKGAGGSAYYILGAAYQTMGSNGAAKSAYASCAKSGCPEAGECASLVDSM
jgi:hypothetical protein